MTIWQVLGCLIGAVMLAAGLLWVGGGRWRWLPRLRGGRLGGRALSEPTRMVIGLSHLVLGYHLVVWSVPMREHRPIQLPRQNWYWLATGCAAAMAGSIALDRLAPLDDEAPDRDET